MTVTDQGKWTQWQQGQRRRETFLEEFRQGGDLDVACTAAGVTRAAYRKWRREYPDFAGKVDMIRAEKMGRSPTEIPTRQWKDGFAAFRLKYFEMESPWFHLDAIRALEEVGGPGEITMILLPPEHGKTTLLEDYISYKLATEPAFRITFGSASQNHARKVGGRVRLRMEEEGSAPTYVYHWGPFAPQKDTKRKSIQPWGADYWSVFKKGDSDERDYSFVALGMGSEIIGSRTDLLIVDDPQSRKTLGLTEQMVEKFRQDWLSRPGTKGRTVILGSRVGMGDFYEGLLDAGIVDHLICYPAINSRGEWLWPERYAPEEYARMRRNVGEEAWHRNYMMQPTAKGDASFSEELIASCKDEYRSVTHDWQPTWPKTVIIGWDPGYGTNVVHSSAVDDRRFWPLRSTAHHGLSSPDQLFQVLEDEILALKEMGYVITDVVVEDKAFQHGLLADERMEELVKRYGFRVYGHQTGGDKNDEDIGVPGMVLSMRREQVKFPSADDASEAAMNPLYDELYRWRPKVRGTKLRQDRVMAMWFSWLWWRRRKHALAAAVGPNRPATPKRKGLPYAPTRVVLTNGKKR